VGIVPDAVAGDGAYDEDAVTALEIPQPVQLGYVAGRAVRRA
jgi:hypothetical protein